MQVRNNARKKKRGRMKCRRNEGDKDKKKIDIKNTEKATYKLKKIQAHER